MGSTRFESMRFGSVRFGYDRFDSVRFGSLRFGFMRAWLALQLLRCTLALTGRNRLPATKGVRQLLSIPPPPPDRAPPPVSPPSPSRPRCAYVPGSCVMLLGDKNMKVTLWSSKRLDFLFHFFVRNGCLLASSAILWQLQLFYSRSDGRAICLPRLPRLPSPPPTELFPPGVSRNSPPFNYRRDTSMKEGGDIAGWAWA